MVVAVLNLDERLAQLAVNGEGTDRGQFLRLIDAGLAGMGVPLEAAERIIHHRDRPVDARLVTAHEVMADAFAGWHFTLPSDVIVEFVTHHAGLLDGLLDCPMPDAHRRRLEVVTVGAHVQAALEAFCGGDRRSARRSFAAARSLADDADDDTLRAQAVGVSAILHSPIEAEGLRGDSRRAVQTMRRAVHHARRADPATRAYSYRWLGLELAAADDAEGFLASYEAGDRLGEPRNQPDGPGFLARNVAMTPDQVSRTRGIGLVRIGRAEEALDALETSRDSAAHPRALVITLADIALARVLQDEPEQSCQQLQHALDLVPEAGYNVGLERICGVRARFPEPWADLTCVRELDERLRAALEPGA